MGSSEKLIKMRSSIVILFVWICLSVDASTLNGCSVIPNEENAYVSESSIKDIYKDGDRLDYTCEHGYASLKKIIYTCMDNKWTKIRTAKCSLKRCELPEDIPNGRYELLNGKTFVYGSTIKYICKEGYVMMSQTDSRTCRDGGWDNRLPVCEEASCALNTTENNINVEGLPNEEELIRYGHRLKFSCVGHGLKLEGQSEITCQLNGQWSSPFPKCVEVQCPLNTTVEDFNIERIPNIEGPFKSGNRIILSCTGEQRQIKGNREITCQSNGEWSSPFPKCKEITCDANLTVNMRSDIKGQPGPEISVKPGHTVTLSCAGKESRLTGPEKITCLSNGQWNVQFPKCVGGICGKPPIVNFADTKEMTKREYRSGETVEYKCFDKYVLDEIPPYSKHKTCHNGEWTGNVNCLKPCSVTLDEMDNIGIRLKYGPPRKIFSPHMDQIQFACQRGKMFGDSKQTCTDGVMILPRCE